MGFIKIRSIEKPLAARPEKNKKPLALACIALSLIFMLSIVMSGCVLHSDGHEYGYKSHHGNGHGHHKRGHGKVRHKVGVSVSPLIVIGD